MNNQVVARPCWTVLAEKAEDKIAAIQNEMGLARKRLESLQSSQQRVQLMYEEYRDKINSKNNLSLGMSETMNQRQFISQLLVLMERVNTDMQHTENLILSIKERLLEAERERIKMQTLADQNASAVQKVLSKRDQKKMDELGVMQFNLQALNS
jgi:flagellar export protein FliJ